MEQRFVTFEVAKALNEAGYPQECTDQVYTELGELLSAEYGEWHKCYDAPTYLDVWLWLWREKGKPIQIDYCYTGIDPNINDPEEAIISEINFLVENNLIK